MQTSQEIGSLVGKIKDSISTMIECYTNLDESNFEMQSILKEYSLKSNLGSEEELRLYLLDSTRQSRQVKAKMIEAQSSDKVKDFFRQGE